MNRRPLRAALALAAASLATAGSPALAGDGIEALDTVRIATGLNYPVGIYAAPGDYTRLYILEKPGRIEVLNTKSGVISPTPFLDINSSVGGGSSVNDERGLLGLAFHPNWPKNRSFFVNYTNNAGTTTIRRFTANDGDTADASSGETVLTIAQPFTNHNGGWIGFGPNDGYLYIATGDGGAAGDPGNRAQDITNQLLGKLLRIDIDGAAPYEIPASNPFVGETGDDEIWAYGLRNPWRCSFDTNGDLYIADVGQNAIEEINYQRFVSAGGLNYGWRCREGNQNYNFSGNCSLLTFVEPFHTYTHGLGLSITGGYVYRGCQIPTLDGTYIFADYASARIWTTDAGGSTANLTERTAELAPDGAGTIARITTFGVDQRGEMYLADQGNGVSGEIYKVVAADPTISDYDLNCSGSVDFQDLLVVLAAWGPCDGCLADLDGNHQVDFDDVLALLAEWG